MLAVLLNTIAQACHVGLELGKSPGFLPSKTNSTSPAYIKALHSLLESSDRAFAMASSVVVALVLAQFLPLVQASSCVTSLEDLETALQSDPLNVESINDAFFPLNTPPSIAADVFYFINVTINGTATVPVHPATMNATVIGQLVPSYSFQWVSQRVLLPFGPELLEVRGLAVFAPKTPMTLLVIPPICITRKESIDDYSVQVGKLLARLTSKVS